VEHKELPDAVDAHKQLGHKGFQGWRILGREGVWLNVAGAGCSGGADDPELSKIPRKRGLSNMMASGLEQLPEVLLASHFVLIDQAYDGLLADRFRSQRRPPRD
jgi:hypothetical protein